MTEHVSLPEGRLRQALQAGEIFVWEWRRNEPRVKWEAGRIPIATRGCEDVHQSLRGLLARIDRSDRRVLFEMAAQSLQTGATFSIELRVSQPDGARRWFSVRGSPIRNGNGWVSGLTGVAFDVTEQKQSLSHTDALLREVSHRTKNLLASILAMARLSAREAHDVKSHLNEFTLRVAGLAASQDLIVAADWLSVDFARLAAAEIEAIARTQSRRVVIDGPPFSVTPTAAQTLGMILTELTLNALDHGALAVPTGQVTLTWSFSDDSTISIIWRETAGSAGASDGRSGSEYGMSVIERFSTEGLRLSTKTAHDPEGFTWTIEGHVAQIGSRPRSR